MILDITYSNIRVFRKPVVFSMETSDSEEKMNNIMTVECDGEEVQMLKVGAIYGPNASGKTTLMSVLHSLRNWLLNINTSYFNDYFAPFYLDTFSRNEPSSIVLRFVVDKMIFRYSVSFLQGKCTEEMLERIDRDREQLMFKRIVTKSGNHRVAFGEIELTFDVSQMEVSPDKSILAVFNNLSVTPFSTIAKYLTSIEIANSYNASMLQELFQQSRAWLKKNGNTKRLVDFINCFDINIKNLKLPQKAESSYKDVKFVHPIKDKEGNFVQDSDFRAGLESGGSLVLTILGAKVLKALDEGNSLFVDELDSGFHTEVTRTIIEMFRDPVINKHNAQLILTTHNVKLMDEQTLRKDQVWFIQKNMDGESELFSLAEFDEVKEFDNFSQWYLAHRFGAVPRPNLLTIRRLFENNHF